MKLWLLRPNRNKYPEGDHLWGGYGSDGWRDWGGYDCAWGMIVAAENEDQARQFAASKAEKEEAYQYRSDSLEPNWTDSDGCLIFNLWLDVEHTDCTELKAEDYNEQTLVMMDYHAG